MYNVPEKEFIFLVNKIKLWSKTCFTWYLSQKNEMYFTKHCNDVSVFSKMLWKTNNACTWHMVLLHYKLFKVGLKRTKKKLVYKKCNNIPLRLNTAQIMSCLGWSLNCLSASCFLVVVNHNFAFVFFYFDSHVIQHHLVVL